jgi:GrpB-like predicted nucleotidyltransferase (UPF0157 family)
MLGLKRGTVKLSKYNSKWPRLFEREKRLLQKTLGDKIIAIEHIGSTAILGITAKPLIDINIAVASLNDNTIKKFIAPLQSLGYTYMHKFPGRRFFAKGPESKRTHHLNLVKANSQTSWHDHLLFRDYLRAHRSARDKYATLKIQLAKQFPADRASYTQGKEKFIKSIINQAQKAK